MPPWDPGGISLRRSLVNEVPQKLKQFVDIVYRFWLQKPSKFENFTHFTCSLLTSMFNGGAKRPMCGAMVPLQITVSQAYWSIITNFGPRSLSCKLEPHVHLYHFMKYCPRPKTSDAKKTHRIYSSTWTHFFISRGWIIFGKLRGDFLIFTVRLHIMQHTVLLSEFCPSARLSDSRVYCDKTKQRTANILISHETAVILFFWHQQWLVDNAPFKSALKMTLPLRKTPTSTDFRS